MVTVLILAAFFAWMGACNLANSKWFLGKRTIFMMPETSIPAYRKLIGLAQLLLAIVFVAYAVIGFSMPVYILFAAIPVLILLYANKKYTGHWFY